MRDEYVLLAALVCVVLALAGVGKTHVWLIAAALLLVAVLIGMFGGAA